jgi:hypothetical protein
MDSLISQALSKGTKNRAKAKAPKHLKSFHAKEQHDGKYHVTKHSGNPTESATEHSADNMQAVHSLMEDHMGLPNAGEPESEQGADQSAPLGAGEPGMGGQV